MCIDGYCLNFTFKLTKFSLLVWLSGVANMRATILFKLKKLRLQCHFVCPQHLLCLVLQALACIATNPGHHQALSDADLPDTLMQLLLPSDEWYYTNHSTKYAPYVKYHAARIVVYMGLFHRLGGRVNLFDMKRKIFVFENLFFCYLL